jgi:hypothetical protein
VDAGHFSLGNGIPGCVVFNWLDGRKKKREEEERYRLQQYAEREQKRKDEETRKRLEQAAKLGRTIMISFIVSQNPHSNEPIPYRVKPVDSDSSWNRSDEYRLAPDKYIRGKTNQNVLISGASGEGKSVLACYLLGCFDSSKLIISFKANDEYLKTGYPVADVARVIPNPFEDLNAFITAFAITFPLDVIGVTASQVPALIYNIANDCEGWKDFMERLEKRINGTRDKVQLTALRFIDEHVRMLVCDSPKDSDSLLASITKGGKSIVFDFSKLNDNAKIFYAELLLRQCWARLQARGEDSKWTILCVDEVHRLLRGSFQRYHSIVHEISREIRNLGALWTLEQNYTDAQDDVRNQFATQLVFKTTSQADLNALGAIDPILKWTASSMPAHHFFDAKEFDHSDLILRRFFAKVAKIDGGELSWVSEAPKPVIYITDEDRVVDKLIVTRLVRRYLENNILYLSQFARLLMDRYKLGEGEAKLLITDSLRPLVEGGEVRRMEFEREDVQTLVLYYKLPEDTAGASILHEFLTSHLRRYLEERGIRIVKIAGIGDEAADIETESSFYEIETGLKKGNVRGLKERAGKAMKPMSVVVPNSAIAERYASLNSGTVQVVTMASLRELSLKTSSGGNNDPTSFPSSDGSSTETSERGVNQI